MPKELRCSQARQILRRIEPILRAIVQGAWEDWGTILKCMPLSHPTARAVVVWNRMIARAQETFSRVEGVAVVECNNTLFFVLDNLLLFRFKKGDETGRSSNSETLSACAFHNPQACIEGLPDLARVEVVYVLAKPYEVSIEDVRVVRRRGREFEWWYSLTSSALVEQLPLEPVIQQPVEHLVKPRDKQVIETPVKKESGDV